MLVLPGAEKRCIVLNTRLSPAGAEGQRASRKMNNNEVAPQDFPIKGAQYKLVFIISLPLFFLSTDCPSFSESDSRNLSVSLNLLSSLNVF